MSLVGSHAGEVGVTGRVNLSPCPVGVGRHRWAVGRMTVTRGETEVTERTRKNRTYWTDHAVSVWSGSQSRLEVGESSGRDGPPHPFVSTGVRSEGVGGRGPSSTETLMTKRVQPVPYCRINVFFRTGYLGIQYGTWRVRARRSVSRGRSSGNEGVGGSPETDSAPSTGSPAGFVPRRPWDVSVPSPAS